jgi:outer membrane biosynthesis protein TonB
MQTPEPESVHDAKDASITELENRLDKLWESYLDLLDHYTKAQDDIKKHMTAGFFSLAKAQSSAPFGRRYGQDWYDERMKSTRRVQVSSDASQRTEDAFTASLQTLSISLANEVERKEDVEKINAKDEEPQPEQQPSPPGTPEPEAKQQSTEDEKTEEEEKPKPVNPLRWYGILVPPELKKAQSSFSMVLGIASSAEGSTDPAPGYTVSPITSAVNAARGLREVETELRKVRKSLKKAEKARITITR